MVKPIEKKRLGDPEEKDDSEEEVYHRQEAETSSGGEEREGQSDEDTEQEEGGEQHKGVGDAQAEAEVEKDGVDGETDLLGASASCEEETEEEAVEEEGEVEEEEEENEEEEDEENEEEEEAYMDEEEDTEDEERQGGRRKQQTYHPVFELFDHSSDEFNYHANSLLDEAVEATGLPDALSNCKHPMPGGRHLPTIGCKACKPDGAMKYKLPARSSCIKCTCGVMTVSAVNDNVDTSFFPFKLACICIVSFTAS